MGIYRRPEDDPKYNPKNPRAIRIQQYPGGGLQGGGGGTVGGGTGRITVQDDESNTVVGDVETLQFEADTFVISTPGSSIAKVDLQNVILADGSVPFTGDQSIGDNFLTDLSDPINDQDAATKFYVDNAIAQSRDFKDSVRVATTTAGTLATSFEDGDTVDGVVLATGDRILIKDQAAAATNGIYTVNASGAPTRATDADTDVEVTPGFIVAVEEGTANADKLFMLVTSGPITLGATALNFAPYGVAGLPSGAAGGVLDGTYPNPGLAAGVAGAGLTETSDVLSVNVDNSTIEINSDTLRVKDAGITNAKLANMAEARIKGRASGAGTGAPQDLTGTQATVILDAVVGDSGSGGTKGLVPAPSAGDAAAGKFLKADGTWAVATATPSGAAGGVLDGTYPNPGLAASVAGDGLTETSNVLSVNVDNTTIEITGDTLNVKAGGIGPTQLAATAVSPGSYTNADITVDADGRITSATSGSSSFGSKWNDITDPDGDLELTMQDHLSTFTYNDATGTLSNLFTLQTDEDDTGTGYLFALRTPGASNTKSPFGVYTKNQSDTNHLSFEIGADGAPSAPIVVSGTVDHTSQRFGAGSFAGVHGSAFGYSADVGGGSAGFGHQASVPGSLSSGFGDFVNISGAGATAVGQAATSAHDGTINLGAKTIAREANSMVVGSEEYPINKIYLGAGHYTGTYPANVTITATTSSNSGSVAANLYLAAGNSTNNATPARVHIRANPLYASDPGFFPAQVDRAVYGATKVLADNTTTTVAEVTVGSNQTASVVVDYQVEVFDGTDVQVETGSFIAQVTNKGGAIANNTITPPTGYPVNITTSGTLAVTWTITAANPALLRVNANSSLTPSTGYPRLTYTLRNLSNQAVTIA